MELKLQEFFYPVQAENVEDNINALFEKFKPHFYTPPLHQYHNKINLNNKQTNIKQTNIKSTNIKQTNIKQTNIKSTNIKLTNMTQPSSISPHPQEIPDGCDSLFWSIYQHMCNIKPDIYTYFSIKPQMAQIQEKSRIIEWIKQNEKLFQTSLIDHRITKGRIQEIMTMLLTGISDNIDCLIAYVAYYNVPIIIWYPNNMTYCTFTPLANIPKELLGEYIVLKYYGKGKIKWKINDNEEFKKENCIQLKHYIGEGGNVLGSDFLYKKDELIKMANILGIETKGTKKELFEKINLSCYIIK
jgi:hypothetical protein